MSSERTPRQASRRRREAWIGVGLLLPSVVLVLVFTLFPVGYNVWLGFYAKHSLRATSASYCPRRGVPMSGRAPADRHGSTILSGPLRLCP